MKNTLDSIIKEIKAVNDLRDNKKVIANDDSNDELLNILQAHTDCEDDEDSLTERFGYDGYCAIREAERGSYPVIMSITGAVLADYCESRSTVIITAEDIDSNEEEFHVQTVDGEYRSDLGCWITTPDDYNDIDIYDYAQFNIDEIVSQAELSINQLNSEENTEYEIDGKIVYLINKFDCVDVVVDNCNYINKYASSYQRRFHVIKSFDEKDDAIKYLESLSD